MDVADDDEVGRGESNGIVTNLSNSSASKKTNRASYLTFGSFKRVDNYIRKCVKAVRGLNYLNPATKKAFNHLRHTFTKVLIYQYFDPERHIRIKTNVSGYPIGKVLSKLTWNDLGH